MNMSRMIPLLYMLLLLIAVGTTLTCGSTAAQAQTTFQSGPNLRVARGVSWSETDGIGTRCYRAYVPAVGDWTIEVTTTAPPAAPTLVVFDPIRGEAGGPSVVARVAGVRVRVAEAGDYVLCLTSSTLLGRVTIRNYFAANSWLKGGDEREVELELEGLAGCGAPPDPTSVV